MTNPAPGWYHGSGDPTGTVRYWDGTAWTTEPLPAPPGWRDPARPSVEYGSAWRRWAAATIDGFFSAAVAAPFIFDDLLDDLDEIQEGGTPSPFEISAEIIVLNLLVLGGFVLMVAFAGDTPGKLLLGLRVTLEDNTTTPPGLARALRRSVLDLAALIPFLGFIAVLALFASFVMVLTDDENRSVYDRIADTRVIRVR